MEWRSVDGWPRYEVSADGRLRNCKSGRTLKPKTTIHGYITYGLTCAGRTRWFTAHRLVAAAFLGPIPRDRCVNHKNGVKNDNRTVNLEIVTHAQNVQHAYATGLVRPARGDSHWSRCHPERISRGPAHASKLNLVAMRSPKPQQQGSKNPAAKLTEADVVAIRRAFAAKEQTQGQLARAYSVSQPVISEIVLRKKWRHVP